MDTVITKLSPHGDSMARVWLEDSYNRLTRNGFPAGTKIAVTDRPGSGLIVRHGELDSKKTVSSRRNAPLLSLDGAWVLRRFEGADFLRVRLSFKTLIIVPRVITSNITRSGCSGYVTGTTLVVDNIGYSIKTQKPLLLPMRLKSLALNITTDNILYAMEIVVNSRPESVTLSGHEMSVASAYLLDVGYTKDGGSFKL